MIEEGRRIFRYATFGLTTRARCVMNNVLELGRLDVSVWVHRS